jgi:hypothetical protein
LIGNQLLNQERKKTHESSRKKEDSRVFKKERRLASLQERKKTHESSRKKEDSRVFKKERRLEFSTVSSLSSSFGVDTHPHTQDWTSLLDE